MRLAGGLLSGLRRAAMRIAVRAPDDFTNPADDGATVGRGCE